MCKLRVLRNLKSVRYLCTLVKSSYLGYHKRVYLGKLFVHLEYYFSFGAEIAQSIQGLLHALNNREIVEPYPAGRDEFYSLSKLNYI
jgi:hypothetical protein